ncbi:MAG: hypothetical protein P1U90_02375 [Akkermansiaceae bacterium]|nr:hypothetical protein [Akkermansiaceae bacterium]
MLEDLKEEKKIDPHVKLPTKAQQKKIINLAHANHPNVPPSELCDEFDEAWEQVQKEAKIAARKRAAKKAAKSGTPPPIPKKKDPHEGRTQGWRNCFLKKAPSDWSDGGGHHGVLQPFFKTPTNDQVLTVLQALDQEKPSWDSKIRKSEKQSTKATSLFANKFGQMFPEMVKEQAKANSKGSGCLVVLFPLVGAIYFLRCHLAGYF